jgi:hypothetical protein
MDPVKNPFSPGAGTPPPALAGREDVLERVRVAIARVAIGKSSKHNVLIGLRGVGKTVLLEEIGNRAEAAGNYVLRIEAPENRSLPSVLVPQLRVILLKMSASAAAADLAKRALRALAGFVRTLKVTYSDIELRLDAEPEVGLADSGDLETALTDLIVASAKAAHTAGSALVILIDELQYVPIDQLGAFIAALHRCAQQQLPVILTCAGLPQLRAHIGKAKTYSERLFEFFELGPLSASDSAMAVRVPMSQNGVAIEDDALLELVRETGGYPYFLQEWGKNTWDIAATSPITASDVRRARELVMATLDASFFAVRFERLTPAEQRYLRAMAELGSGPHRSGDIAEVLGKQSRELGPIRNNLIAKGMIWSPSHGDTAFTVPLFDQFIRRAIPTLT